MTIPPANATHNADELAPRHPLRAVVLLAVEFCVLAIPFNAAYGYAMRIVYQLPPTAGLLFAIVAAAVLCNAYWLWARFVVRRDPGELAIRRSGWHRYRRIARRRG